MTRGPRQGISGDLAHESARDGINRPVAHRSSEIVPPILHIDRVLERRWWKNRSANGMWQSHPTKAPQLQVAVGRAGTDQVRCQGASLVKRPPVSIHGQVIGRNRRNSLIPVLSYCCSLAVAIVTADLSPASRPGRQGEIEAATACTCKI